MANSPVSCTIKFDTYGSDDFDKGIWQPFETRLPASISTRELDRRMQQRVSSRLRKDKVLLQKVRAEERLLFYETDIFAYHCGMPNFRVGHDDEHTLETLADLFPDLGIEEKKLNVDLNVWSGDPRPHYQNQPKATQKVHLKKRLSVSEIVQSGPRSDKDHWEYRYVTLGIREPASRIPPPGHDRKTYIPNSNDTVCKDPTVDAWLKGPTVCFENMIIGYWVKDYTDYAASFHMITVQAWDFGDYCIGNPEDEFRTHTMSGYDNYLKPFEKAKDAAEMHICASRQLRKRTPAKPVPFMPTYTLNMFDPASHKLGVKGSNIDAVVRFVDDLGVPYHGRKEEPNKWLPFNAQWTFKPQQSANSIYEDIRWELFNHAHNPYLEQAEKRSILRLYNAPLQGLWQLQVWVLPQPRPGEKGARKMYKYPVDRNAPARSLSEFLCPERVKQDGTAARGLYMEAHIIKKANVEQKDLRKALKQVRKWDKQFWQQRKGKRDVEEEDDDDDDEEEEEEE